MPLGDAPGTAPVDTRLLRAFAEDVFQPLGRADQRRWAQAYLRALLSVPGKKTMRRLAAAAAPTTQAANGLQQFINNSPWEWTPVRQAVFRTVTALGPPRAWSVAEVTIPKRGEHSVGVHRRFDAESGRTVNCQVALALFVVTDSTCVPVDWRLLLGDAWCRDAERRARARIPASVEARPAGAHILDFAARAAACGRAGEAPWLLDLRHHPEAAEVLDGLVRHGADFVCEVSAEQLARLSQAGPPAGVVAEAAAHSPTRRAHRVARPGSPGGREPFTVHFGRLWLAPAAGRASGGNQATGVPCTYLSLARPASQGRHHPERFWITSLTEHRMEETLALVRSAAGVGRCVADLQAHYGVQDFEGRSFPGWHHHMTMVSAAYAFRQLHPVAPPALPPPAPDRARRPCA
ncbi:transposase [Streptomyces sp. NPDC053431]|uniref:IS701 family transposase n=1 Tax=Streptomyces sp. NPDC053431 TaxID=3365703 RepID=UPI0037D70466